jgi:hypothetical protein
MVEEPELTGDSALFEGLEMHIEVWNAAVLSGRIYSAMGPIRVVAQAAAGPGDHPSFIHSVTGPHRKEVAGPAFSAAIFNPVDQKYPTIADCIIDAHQPNNPLHLCMRVTVTDRRTGKMALVWESGKPMNYVVCICRQWVLNALPQAACHIFTKDWTRLHRQDQKQIAPSECCDGGNSINRLHGMPLGYDEGFGEMSAYVGFPLQVLRGQGNVHETENKYVAGIMPTYHSSLAEIHFKEHHAKTIASFFSLSLLE